MAAVRTLILMLLVMGQSPAWAGTPADTPANAGDGLIALLPVMEGIKPEGAPRQARTAESLFGCINGGAEIFLRNGFKQAVFQTYVDEKGKHFNLEIYEMATEKGAGAMFSKNSTEEDKRVAIGDEAITGNYYIIFRKANFYVAMTGFEPGRDTLDLLDRVARTVDNAMAAGK